jgi:hypothetical protein
LDYNTFKLKDFEFVDESHRETSWWSRISSAIMRSMSPRTDTGPAPIKLKETEKQNETRPPLEYLCDAIGFDSPSVVEVLSYHRGRFKLYNIVRSIIYFLFALPIVESSIFGFTWLFIILGSSMGKINVLSNSYLTALIKVALFALVYLILMLYLFVVIRTGLKVASVLPRKHFADTICIFTVVYLVIELSRDDVLSHPEKRRALAARVSDLARNTLFLPLRFATRSEAEQIWLRAHFKHIERYIRERERWVAVPVETTLADLRQDFYNLARIYITSSYGEFAWSAAPSTTESLSPTRTKRLVEVLPRMVGITLPIILMGLLISQHQRLEIVGIGTNIIALILIAWLLLAIDAILKLGIVASVVSLAKGIKELK